MALCLFLMRENISEAKLSSPFRYFGASFIYTREMILSLVISPFPSKETLISSLKMILFGQQILRCKLFQISSYVTEQMAVLWL